MGTVYTLPVLNYPNLQPNGAVVVNSISYDNCVYGLRNSLLIASSSSNNGVGGGSNVAGTLSAWYGGEVSGRYYYVAVNYTSDWIHSTVSISDLNSEVLRSVAWGYTNRRAEIYENSNNSLNLPFLVDAFQTKEEAISAITNAYPIIYSYTNSTVSGPAEAAIGDTVIVSAVPNVDYGITDASSQIIVTNNDVAVPYTWDAANNTITFTMPDPT